MKPSATAASTGSTSAARAEDLLAPEALAREGMIDSAPVARAWAEHLSGRHDWKHRLWIILMFAAWRRRMARL